MTASGREEDLIKEREMLYYDHVKRTRMAIVLIAGNQWSRLHETKYDKAIHYDFISNCAARFPRPIKSLPLPHQNKRYFLKIFPSNCRNVKLYFVDIPLVIVGWRVQKHL